MVPLVALILAAASPDTPPEPQLANGGRNVVSLFSSDDYPYEAMQNNWQGDVIVTLRIGTDGRPRICRIVLSSGHEPLDLATCRIMLTRAKFTPARDSNGNAVEDDFKTPVIHWRLVQEPEPEPQPAPQ